MIRRAGLAIAVLVASCAAPAPSDPRIVVLPDAGIVVLQSPHATMDATGISHVSALLYNPRNQDAVIESTTDWFDRDQHAIGGLLSMPRRIVVPRFGTASLESVSPSARAVAYQIRIAPGV